MFVDSHIVVDHVTYLWIVLLSNKHLHNGKDGSIFEPSSYVMIEFSLKIGPEMA